MSPRVIVVIVVAFNKILLLIVVLEYTRMGLVDHFELPYSTKVFSSSVWGTWAINRIQQVTRG